MLTIAEVGSNYNTLADCINSIGLAKNCGAAKVKFQAFNERALYGMAIYPSEISDGMPGQLPLEWLPQLSAKAKSVGIEFMCSAFSPELAEIVNEHVSTHKIASAELTHKRLLQKINTFKKPVILSTGASGEADIDFALTCLKDCPVTLMFCIAAYPARYINFANLDRLKRFGRPVGYSDHSIDVLNIPRLAQDRGAVVLEKHVNFVGAKGPDAPFALNTDEFKYMVQMLKNGNAPFGIGEENEMILRHNRRLIATRDITAGEVFDEHQNFGIFRALADMPEALSPWLIDSVNGQKALKDIKAGQAITKDCF